MPNPHDQLIADAAKQALGPLRFRRKGRSRIWILDQGWWLNVVEFQPSGWAKGSYLNVNAHCLWIEQEHISYEYGGRSAPFSAYLNADQFEGEATRLTQAAAKAAEELNRTFETIEAAAAALMAKEQSLPEPAKGSWPAYHAAMASALSGRTDDAAALFQLVWDARVRPAAARVEKHLHDPVAFRRESDALIAAHRTTLGFAPTF